MPEVFVILKSKKKQTKKNLLELEFKLEFQPFRDCFSACNLQLQHHCIFPSLYIYRRLALSL